MEKKDEINVLRRAIQPLILPCPCCGSKDVYYKITDDCEKVGCGTCGLNMTRVHGCKIIPQWNNRTSLTE